MLKLKSKHSRTVGWSFEGDKHYSLNDKPHRTDGLAAKGYNGYKRWYLNDKYLTKHEWKNKIKCLS